MRRVCFCQFLPINYFSCAQVYKRGSQTAGDDLEALDPNARGAAQSLRCRVMKAGMLAMVPDPITCFEDASFKQVRLSS